MLLQTLFDALQVVDLPCSDGRLLAPRLLERDGRVAFSCVATIVLSPMSCYFLPVTLVCCPQGMRGNGESNLREQGSCVGAATGTGVSRGLCSRPHATAVERDVGIDNIYRFIVFISLCEL